MGGGNLTNTNFPSKSTTNATFPISIAYDRNQDKGFTIIRQILSKCGVLGGSDGEITILYDLKAKVKILGINFSPDIKNQSYNVKCPVNVSLLSFVSRFDLLYVFFLAKLMSLY